MTRIAPERQSASPARPALAGYGASQPAAVLLCAKRDSRDSSAGYRVCSKQKRFDEVESAQAT